MNSHLVSLRQRLKDSTRPLHDQVEATNYMGRLMRDDLTAADYAHTMRGLHALYTALEAELTRVPGLVDALPDLPARLKTAALANDLRALSPSGTGDQLARLPKVAPITSVAGALGTLYVLEGSTMGGRLIAAKLKTRDFIRGERLHFFEHYGADSGRYWQRFTKTLEEIPAEGHDEVVAAALRTFEYFIALA